MKKLVIAAIVILSVVSQVAYANQDVTNDLQQEETVKLAQAAPALDTQKLQRQLSKKLQARIQDDFEKQLEMYFKLDI